MSRALIIIDLSQIEMRRLADILLTRYQDNTLANAIQESDIHSYNAFHILSNRFSTAFQEFYGTRDFKYQGENYKTTPLNRFRDDCKTTGYALNYGMGPGQLCIKLRDEKGEPSPKEYAQSVIEGWFNLYKGQKQFNIDTWNFVTQNGFTTTESGWVRPLLKQKYYYTWENKHKAPQVCHRAWRQALNNEMQEYVAKMMAELMLRMNTVQDPFLINRGWFNETLASLDYKMSLQVHDELIGHGPKSKAEKIAEEKVRVCKEDLKYFPLSIPVDVQWSIGESWGIGH